MNDTRRSINTSVRLPGELHDRLRQQASRQDRTPHWLILRYIQRGLEQDEREQEGQS